MRFYCSVAWNTILGQDDWKQLKCCSLQRPAKITQSYSSYFENTSSLSSFLFFSCLPVIHSYNLRVSHAARVRSRTFTECGGGKAETTEQRWSLKVRYKRDAAEQALSLSYTAGSVTTDCSSATIFPSSHNFCLSTWKLYFLFFFFALTRQFPTYQLPLKRTLFFVYFFFSQSLSLLPFFFLDYCHLSLSDTLFFTHHTG